MKILSLCASQCKTPKEEVLVEDMFYLCTEKLKCLNILEGNKENIESSILGLMRPLSDDKKGWWNPMRVDPLKQKPFLRESTISTNDRVYIRPDYDDVDDYENANRSANNECRKQNILKEKVNNAIAVTPLLSERSGSQNTVNRAEKGKRVRVRNKHQAEICEIGNENFAVDTTKSATTTTVSTTDTANNHMIKKSFHIPFYKMQLIRETMFEGMNGINYVRSKTNASIIVIPGRAELRPNSTVQIFGTEKECDAVIQTFQSILQPRNYNK